MADKFLSSLVGGGGGFIGDVKPLNVNDTGGLFVQDGQSWLKTGVVNTDTASYPDAKIGSETTGVYSGTSFSVASQDTRPSGITWDGTHLWVVGDSNNAVYKYTAAGTYTGTSFSVASQDTQPSGITWDGTHFWVVGTNGDAASKYTSAGVYTNTNFSVASQESTPQGITWDGTHFWVIGSTNDTAYKYNSIQFVGLASASTEYSVPTYVRIK